MPIDQSQMMQAVYDAIYNAIAVTPPGGGPISGANPILSLARPGIAVDPKDFTNALSTTNPGGLISSLEAFSLLIDPAPLFSAAYTPGHTASASYGRLVNGQADPMTPTDAQQKAFDEAQGVLYDSHGGDSAAVIKYHAAMGAYQTAVNKYNTAYWAINLATGPGQRQWAQQGPPLRQAVAGAWQALSSAQPGVIENAMATVAQFGASGGSAALNGAKLVYQNASIQGVLAGDQFWPSYAYPTDWMDDASDSAYTTITISSSSMKTSKTSSYNAYSAGGSASWGLWSVGGSSSGQFTHNSMNQDTSDLQVSFKFARITISRPWLNSGLFGLRGLLVGNLAAGGFSSGKADPSNTGILPVLVNSIIVAKEIAISASWGHADSDFISQTIKASASVGWGPFSVSGSYEHSSSKETMNSTFDGTTLKLPGMNVFGFVSTLVPFSPAVDG